MIETLADREGVSATPQLEVRDSGPASALKGAEAKLRLAYAIRFALAMGVIILWALLPLRSILTGWVDPEAAASQVVVAQQTPTKTDIFLPVLYAAREYCPRQPHVLMLNNDSYADNLADYYVYPGRVDMLRLGDPFGGADLDAHVGGCLIYYSPQAGQRLDPFRARLKEIFCTDDGCLYSIER